MTPSLHAKTPQKLGSDGETKDITHEGLNEESWRIDKGLNIHYIGLKI